MFRQIRTAFLGLSLLSFAACAQMCAPDQVAMGVARLTTLNADILVVALANDTKCGFQSDAVLQSPTMNGAVGSAGSMTWTVKDCTLDFGDKGKTVNEPNCDGETKKAYGKVKIKSATKVVGGMLTGVPTSPIIPGGPDAVTIKVDGTFENYYGEKFDKDDKSISSATMLWKDGGISGQMKPRLAVAAATGACAVQSSHTAFAAVKYEETNALLRSGTDEIEVTIQASDLKGADGKAGGFENDIEGTITIWDTEYEIPIPGDEDGLNPDYDAKEFIAGFSCNDELADPISFECADMTPLLADNSARLTVKSFATVAGIISADTNCGFLAPAVAGAPTITGNLGDVGSAEWTVTDCTVTLPADTALSADCAGNNAIAGGSFTVSGTKTVEGRITGDPMAPIIPTSDAPAEVELSIAFTDFKVASSNSNNALLHKSGSLSGTLTPRTALGTSGACEVQSSVARIENLTYTDAVVALSSDSGTFDITIDSSDMDALNGTWGNESNSIAGTMTIDGESLTVPSDGAGLDPTFSQATFDASWQCGDALIMPVSHECAFVAPLTTGISRLTVKAFATAASLASADSTCGFMAPAVAGAPTVTGTLGSIGSATFTVSDCTVNFPTQTDLSADCSGATTNVEGAFTFSGTKTVEGWITGDPYAPIVPASDEPAVVALDISFNGFKLGSSTDGNTLTISSGDLSGSLIPRTALSTVSNACEIQSPVAKINDLTYDTASVILVSDGKTFNVDVAASDFDAVNGTWGTDSNTLSGTVTVDSIPYPVPIDGAGLNPDFDQTAFDTSWQCTPNLTDPVDHSNCSFLAPLAQGAARGLIKVVATATKMLDGNTTCGLGSMGVLGAGVVTGTPGTVGSIAWTATSCTVHVPVDMALGQDCTGTATHAMGGFTATDTTKTVVGMLTGSPTAPIAPGTRDAAEIAHTSLDFTDFMVYDLPMGATDPAAKFTFTGELTGTVGPIAAASASTSGTVYHISTPVASFTDIQVASGTMTMVSEGKTFVLDLTTVDLDAFNGTWYDGTDTMSNSIAGSLTVEGAPIPALPDPRLNPDFDQASFDEGYACTPDMYEPIPYE